MLDTAAEFLLEDIWLPWRSGGLGSNPPSWVLHTQLSASYSLYCSVMSSTFCHLLFTCSTFITSLLECTTPLLQFSSFVLSDQYLFGVAVSLSLLSLSWPVAKDSYVLEKVNVYFGASTFLTHKRKWRMCWALLAAKGKVSRMLWGRLWWRSCVLDRIFNLPHSDHGLV